MSERLNLIVEDGVGDLLSQLAQGERRRGQWVSDLVKAMIENREQAAASSLDELRLSFIGLLSEVKLQEARMLKLEGQVSALMSRTTELSK